MNDNHRYRPDRHYVKNYSDAVDKRCSPIPEQGDRSTRYSIEEIIPDYSPAPTGPIIPEVVDDEDL